MRWPRLFREGSSLARYGDIVLASLIVGIVAMMIVPLPTFLLDILITTNISISVLLLLVCIYVTSALRIATLPSILLITTLFRLGLNVSSTRLILLQADAGEVIRSFGTFVVAGNLVVGAVIFLILTLIQFIVIAKGGERVAEVAARFTLDAMPGRQMAIDADLRAGAIDLDEARRQRAALQRESQLFGSMDGAMRFVKGDAVAGILIIIINIVGGLLIGVLQRGMALGDAAMVYSILTVGDGLVSQIPALLTSTAAGIVVTRVASEDAQAHLGHDIGVQVLAHPRAIALAAILLALLAVVPGMPTAPFLLLAAVIGALAWGAARRQRAQQLSERLRTSPAESGASAVPDAAGVVIEVGVGLAPAIDASGGGGRLMRELVPALRELLHAELGLPLPSVQLRTARGLDPRGYRILLADVPMGEGTIAPDEVWVLATAGELEAAGLRGAVAEALPGVRGPVSRLVAAAGPRARQLGLELVDAPTRVALHLGQLVRQYGFELIGIQEAQLVLDALARTHPALVHEVVPRIVALPTLAEVLRHLAAEQISIRDLRQILEALARWGKLDKDPEVLADHARVALRRYISHRHGAADRTIHAYLLDPAIEEAVRDSVCRTERGSYLAMEPDLSRDIVEAVRRQLAARGAEEPPAAVLTTMELRRHVRRLLEVDFPDLPVLAHSELLPSLRVQPVARVSVTT
jgi:type III secretion protein V